MSYGFLSCHILCVVFQKKNANNSCSYMKNTWVSLCSKFTRTKSFAHLRRTQIGTSLSHHPLFCRFFCSHSNLRAVKKALPSRNARFANFTWFSTGKFSGKPWETFKLIFHAIERVVIVWLQVFLLIWSAVQVWVPLLAQRTLSQLTSTKCVRRSASGHW